MSYIEKGYKYEVFVKNHIINNLNKEAYLWKDIPEKILLDCNLIHSHNEKRLKRKEKLYDNNPLIDVGIDILQKDEDNFTFVQCKNGYGTGLRIEDLAGFYMQMFNHTNVNGNVYYTSKLSRNITENAINNRIQYIKLLMNKTETKEESKAETEFKPHDYQIEASNKIINYLGDNNDKNRAILSMPCGCGKTYTSYLIANKYDKVIMISPLKQFAKQNLDHYVQYGRTNTLLLDSDGTRDIDQVNEFINNNAKFLISATYKSVDILQQLNLTNSMIIIDEFHNLSKNNVCNEEDDFYKLLISNNKFLLMSATPRIYELEDDDENNNIDLGEIVYNITFTEAIQKKYICDYKIWLPSIHEDNSDLINEIGIEDIDNELKTKCMFLFKNLLYHGSKKCILYCQDTNNLNDIKDCIVKLNDFYAIDLNIQEITSETSYKNREKILTVFESSNKIELLLSIRICDECIDIPACDSIYITYPSNSKIRTIQRLCRCIRTDKNNKFKIGNIFIWCNDYNSILNTLSGIKEYDILFKNKISILETNFMNKKEIDEKYIEDEKLIEKYVLDIKEFRQYTWKEKLIMIKQYIDVNGNRPSYIDKDIGIRQLTHWIDTQKQNYKKKEYNMKYKKIYNEWTQFINEYQEYFLSNEEIWYNNFNKVKEYIDKNKKKPYDSDKNKEIKQLGRWIGTQQQKYKNKENIMSNEEIFNEWTQFMNEYQEYFLSNKEIWYNNFNKVKEYIIENGKRPSGSNKIKEIKQMAQWISDQQQKYKKKEHIMKDEEIYNEWIQFMNEYLKSNEEIWYDNLNKVKKYIDENKKKPSQIDKNKQIKLLALWLNTQQKNYKKKEQIMKNEEIYNEWKQFMNEYQEYFLSNKEIWYDNLNKVKEYIDNNKKRPSKHDKDKEIKQLGCWIGTQQPNYKKKEHNMNNKEIYNDWTQFINEYQEYFN
jgi:superfamily II DNA or RNA helicase